MEFLLTWEKGIPKVKHEKLIKTLKDNFEEIENITIYHSDYPSP